MPPDATPTATASTGPAPAAPASAAGPRHRRSRTTWIAVAVAVVLVIAGGVTAALLLTRDSTSPSAAPDLVVDYRQAPTDTISVRADQLLPVDDDSQGDTTLIAVAASPQQLVVMGSTAQHDTDGDQTSYATVVAAVGPTGTVLWRVDGDVLWDGAEPGSARDLGCQTHQDQIVCVANTDWGADVTTIDPSDGSHTTVEMQGHAGGASAPGITFLGDDILSWKDDDEGTYRVSRFDLATQQPVWTATITFRNDWSPYARMVGGYLVIDEAFSADVMQTDLIDPDTGTIAAQLDGALNSPDGKTWYGAANPASDSGTRGVRAVKADGSTLWSQPSGNLLGAPQRAGDVVMMSVGNSTDHVRVYALDPATGDRLWGSSTPLGTNVYYEQIASTVLVTALGQSTVLFDATTGDVIGHAVGDYAGTSGSAFYTHDSKSGSLFAYDASTGRRIWRTDVDSIVGSTGGDGDSGDGLYVYPVDGYLVAQHYDPVAGPTVVALLPPSST